MPILQRVPWPGIGPLLILRDFPLTALVECTFSSMSNLVAFVAIAVAIFIPISAGVFLGSQFSGVVVLLV